MKIEFDIEEIAKPKTILDDKINALGREYRKIIKEFDESYRSNLSQLKLYCIKSGINEMPSNAKLDEEIIDEKIKTEGGEEQC